jgi:putative oxidoreductase
MPFLDSPAFKLADRAYGWFAKLANWFAIVLLLFFRLNFGYQFFTNGRGKLINHPDIVDFFTELHIPFPDLNAWFVGGVECVGGILLIVGLATRPVGLILAINMIVAYLAVEDDRGKVFNFFKDQDAFFQADPFFFLLTALLAFAFGGGPISIDGLIARWIHKKPVQTSQEPTDP